MKKELKIKDLQALKCVDKGQKAEQNLEHPRRINSHHTNVHQCKLYIIIRILPNIIWDFYYFHVGLHLTKNSQCILIYFGKSHNRPLRHAGGIVCKIKNFVPFTGKVIHVIHHVPSLG